MKGGFVGTLSQGGPCSIKLPSMEIKRFSTSPHPILKRPPVERFNDGKIDPAGRFVIGTMPENYKAEGCFAVFDHKNLTPRVLVSEIAITNGPTWSLDGQTFYYVDSMNPPVWKCDYNVETGEVSNKKVFCEMNKEIDGIFSGACIDSQGYLWWAIFQGSKVVRLNPNNGEVDMILDLKDLGVQNVTTCTFGGEDYRTMFITSESQQPGNEVTPGNSGCVCLVEFDKSEGICGVEPYFWKEE